MNSRYILLLLLASLLFSLIVGCIGFSTNWEASWMNRFEHEKRHFRAFWQDMADIHRFIDRHLFNFDELDPTRY